MTPMSFIKGFIIMKAMPFHQGHMALIEYAKSNCDYLTILIAGEEGEPIPIKHRLNWVTSAYLHDPQIEVFGGNITTPPDLSYDDLSRWWGKYVLENYGQFSKVFSSEEYGMVFANTLGAKNCVFNQARTIIPISATMIRNKPFKYWDYLNNHAKDFFVKKIAIVGTESTGKTVMCQQLAAHYNTDWCPELGRELIPDTEACTIEDLKLVGIEHAKHILKHTRNANKILFVDTDLTITQSYAKYLFDRKIEYPHWVEDVNEMDKYFYLYGDVPYINDGTRLSEKERNKLSGIHMKGFKDGKIELSFINWNGDYDFRLEEVIKQIDEFIKQY